MNCSGQQHKFYIKWPKEHCIDKKKKEKLCAGYKMHVANKERWWMNVNAIDGKRWKIKYLNAPETCLRFSEKKRKKEKKRKTQQSSVSNWMFVSHRIGINVLLYTVHIAHTDMVENVVQID